MVHESSESQNGEGSDHSLNPQNVAANQADDSFPDASGELPPPQYRPGPSKDERSLDSQRIKSDDKKQDTPIHVLVIGETQNGKSTLIRQLGVYAGVPEIDINIGRGNVSCTQTVGEYQIATALRRYVLKDFNGRDLKKMPYTDMVDLTDDDAEVVALEPDNSGKTINFSFIDTPGLDDSDGNDMEIMANIIGRVGEFDHLNAVVYVRKMDRPFGASFVKFFNYIQRSMPSICQGLIIAHTSFTVEKVDEFLQKKQDLAKIRQEAFKTATSSKVDLTHFFMDNNPDESSPFAICESNNAIYRLLNLISVQKSLPVTDLKLLRTPNMKNVDVHILLSLEQLYNRLKDAWSLEISNVDRSKGQAMRATREAKRLAGRLQDYQSQLDDLDVGSSINLGTKNISADYSFIKTFLFEASAWLDDKEVEFDADCPITNVEKTVTGGSRWLGENLRGNSWRGTLTSGAFRSINGSATFYTTSRLKYSREIALLKNAITDTQHALDHQEEMLQELGSVGLEDRAILIAGDVEKCQTLMGIIKRETFDVALWPVLKRFYVRTSHESLTKDHIIEYVKVYDPRLAELL